VFSESTAHGDIHYNLSCSNDGIVIDCDESLLSQAMLNILKNAAESLEPSIQAGKKGQIDISLSTEDKVVIVRIADNGPGFPVDKLSSLTEPYVTTRAKGTGLGLAIVKKTIEEHRGKLTLHNNDESGGAVATLRFPLAQHDTRQG
jgi:two-component system nitrogen regulation sensor histidine kinase NtrY